MKYSQQQLKNIERTYETMRKRVQMTNLKANALQNVIINKQIPEDLLDRRNINDIENDIFYRKAVLNDYTNELLPTHKVHDFQKLLKQHKLETFFIQNFPRIQSESKMYKFIDEDILFKITKRLDNVNRKELNEDVEFENKKQYMYDIMTLLNEILDNLKKSPKNNNTNDFQNKTEAIIETIDNITNNSGDEKGFVNDIFKINTDNSQLSIDIIRNTINNLEPEIIQEAYNRAMDNAEHKDGIEQENNYNMEEKDNDDKKIIMNEQTNKEFIDRTRIFLTVSDYADFLASLSNVEPNVYTKKRNQDKMFDEFKKKYLPKLDTNDLSQKILDFYLEKIDNINYRQLQTLGSHLKKFGYKYDRSNLKPSIKKYLEELKN